MHGGLAKQARYIPHETRDSHVVTPVFFDEGLNLRVQGAKQDESAIGDCGLAPGLEQDVDTLALDERANKDGAEFLRRRLRRSEARDIDAAMHGEELLLGMPAMRKVSRAFSDRTKMRVARSYSSITCWRETSILLKRFCGKPAAARSRSLLVRLGFTLPLLRCQVGISSTLGILSRLATRRDCTQSPDQEWSRSKSPVSRYREAMSSMVCFFAPM